VETPRPGLTAGRGPFPQVRAQSTRPEPRARPRAGATVPSWMALRPERGTAFTAESFRRTRCTKAPKFFRGVFAPGAGPEEKRHARNRKP
jgi:hypothetical protein